MKNLKYDDHLEKILSAIFGIIGILAIILNLGIKGVTSENTLDAVKDIAGLVVTIMVFLLASKMFRKMNFQDFAGKFEEYLRDWAEQNRFLIDTKSVEEEMGKEKKRSYFMLTDHSNFVTAEAIASEITKKKGAFLYLPTRDQLGELRQTIEFKLNESTFKRQEKYQDVHEIVLQFVKRIHDEFVDTLGIKVEPSTQDPYKIVISLDGVERTEENAKKLIDLVEFVKTMVLALA
jgi:hypothetical protein